jgi:hypothetical protein
MNTPRVNSCSERSVTYVAARTPAHVLWFFDVHSQSVRWWWGKVLRDLPPIFHSQVPLVSGCLSWGLSLAAAMRVVDEPIPSRPPFRSTGGVHCDALHGCHSAWRAWLHVTPRGCRISRCAVRGEKCSRSSLRTPVRGDWAGNFPPGLVLSGRVRAGRVVYCSSFRWSVAQLVVHVRILKVAPCELLW